MTLPVITREQLIAAVEAGIDAAHSCTQTLTDAEREKLREFGRTAERVATGVYFSERYKCGCPLFEALGERGEGAAAPGTRSWTLFLFTGGFDAAIFDVLVGVGIELDLEAVQVKA